MQTVKKNKVKEDKDKTIFHTKISLEEETKKFHEALEAETVKKFKYRIQHKREAYKIIKHHTPYCYKYHQQFFRNECKDGKC